LKRKFLSMKRILSVCCLLAGLFILTGGDALAQKKKKKATSRKVNNRNKPAAVAVDTPVVAVAPPVVEEMDTIPLRAVAPSRRPNTTVTGDLVKDKTPLAYDNLRVDDQVYRQVIWREIDVREKMNLPFKYEADEDNGNQRFFSIILKAIKDGDVTAFDAANDRFTTPMEVGRIATMLAGKKYTIQKPDLEKDPDMSLGIMKDTTIRDDFDERTIIAYRVKEEVVFDRETSRLHFRILGVAPVKAVLNDDGSYRDSYALFWLYYPEMRSVLSKYEAYNPRNFGARMSWEEIFESRYFASYILKSTISNPFDKTLASVIADPLLRLFEGETIKDQIFNWEQDQWSY
jgi:gliding motility associated protien GldN